MAFLEAPLGPPLPLELCFCHFEHSIMLSLGPFRFTYWLAFQNICTPKLL